MKKYITVLLWLATVTLLLIFSDTVSDITYRSLVDTLKNVFPVLFPYSVIASIMVSMGGSQLLSKLLPANKMFLMPNSAAAPIICGAICGFPLGAKTACDMYQNGIYSKKEAETVISISNNTGPAFVISIIGAKYYSSVEVGIVIYVVQFISAIIASLSINGSLKEKVNCKTHNISFGGAFSEAVKSSFISCLYVCGFISIFSSVLYAVSFLPKGLYGALCPILEFTQGASYGAKLNNISGLFITAFSVGWSGLSVIAQTMSYTYPLGLSVRPLIRFKAIQGLLCGTITAVYFTSARIYMLTAVILLVTSLYVIRKSNTTIMGKLREN